MTPVVLVEHPIPTSEQEQWRPLSILTGTPQTEWEPLPEWSSPESFAEYVAQGRGRTVTVVDPVFVVLPEAPDLACRDCHGTGESIEVAAEGTFEGRHWTSYKLCPSCNGTGVSPVYAATWQCHHYTGGPWVALCGPPGHSHPERRQVVEWRATRVEPLPVRDRHPVSPMIAEYFLVGHGFVQDWTDSSGRDVTNEPWAVDLRPGQFVLRLDGWEHLATPLTEMACDCDNGNVTDEHGIDQCPRCSSVLRVPLSVPDGVLSWIELA